MAWSRRKFSVSHRTQLAAQCRQRDRDLVTFLQPPHQIDQPPSHDAMNVRCRPFFHYCGEGLTMRRVQDRRRPRRLAVDQAGRPTLIEFQHPVSDDLHRHAANPGSLGSRHAVVYRRQRQQPSCLRAILRSPRRQPYRRCVKIRAKKNGHGKLPSFANLNQLSTPLATPYESAFPRNGITPSLAACLVGCLPIVWFTSSQWPLPSRAAVHDTLAKPTWIRQYLREDRAPTNGGYTTVTLRNLPDWSRPACRRRQAVNVRALPTGHLGPENVRFGGGIRYHR